MTHTELKTGQSWTILHPPPTPKKDNSAEEKTNYKPIVKDHQTKAQITKKKIEKRNRCSNNLHSNTYTLINHHYYPQWGICDKRKWKRVITSLWQLFREVKKVSAILPFFLNTCSNIPGTNGLQCGIFKNLPQPYTTWKVTVQSTHIEEKTKYLSSISS